MTKKEKHYTFTALQQILECLKYKPILYFDEETTKKYNKRLDDIIEDLEELKGKNND